MSTPLLDGCQTRYTGQGHSSWLHISIVCSILYEPFAGLWLPFLMQWMPIHCIYEFFTRGIYVTQTFLVFSENQYCAILFRYRKSLNKIFCCLHIEKENPFFDLFIQWKITALKGAVYHSYCTSALQYASMTMLNMVAL